MTTLRWHYDEEYKAWFTRYRGVTIECASGLFSAPSVDELTGRPFLTYRIKAMLEHIEAGIIFGKIKIDSQC